MSLQLAALMQSSEHVALEGPMGKLSQLTPTCEHTSNPHDAALSQAFVHGFMGGGPLLLDATDTEAPVWTPVETDTLANAPVVKPPVVKPPPVTAATVIAPGVGCGPVVVTAPVVWSECVSELPP